MSKRSKPEDIQHPTQQEEQALRFGFDPRNSLEEDAKQYLPFLDYLSKATGRPIKLHFSRQRPISDDLGEGLVDFAAIGATSYILAREKYGVTPVVRGLNPQGQATYRSRIVVRPDSPITELGQLRGKRFAFGSMYSTQGHLIPRIMLRKAGLTLDDLGGYDYTGSHYNCADAVVSGKADACGMQDVLADSLAGKGLLRVLASSAPYPSSGIAASRDVPPELLAKVTQALLDFRPQGKDKPGLYHWELTEMPQGFTRAVQADYAQLRDWMLRFGMLSSTPGSGDGRSE